MALPVAMVNLWGSYRFPIFPPMGFLWSPLWIAYRSLWLPYGLPYVSYSFPYGSPTVSSHIPFSQISGDLSWDLGGLGGFGFQGGWLANLNPLPQEDPANP